MKSIKESILSALNESAFEVNIKPESDVSKEIVKYLTSQCTRASRYSGGNEMGDIQNFKITYFMKDNQWMDDLAEIIEKNCPPVDAKSINPTTKRFAIVRDSRKDDKVEQIMLYSGSRTYDDYDKLRGNSTDYNDYVNIGSYIELNPSYAWIPCMDVQNTASRSKVHPETSFEMPDDTFKVLLGLLHSVKYTQHLIKF